MSATTTSTLTTTTLVGTRSAMTNASTSSERSCPTCGGNGNLHDPAEAQYRIQELEGQIQELNERAAVTGKLQPDPWFCSLKRTCRMPASRLVVSFQSLSRLLIQDLSLTNPCHLHSRQTRRLRRANTQTALLTSRLRHTAKQFLAAANIIPSRESALTDPSSRPHLPRHNIASLPASPPQQTGNPDIPPPLPSRKCHTN